MIIFPHSRGLLYKSTSGAFSPSSLSPHLWFNADDSSTVFDASTGGTIPDNAEGVGRWVDKSSNGYSYIQATTANRPAYQSGSGPNSRSFVKFSSASHTLARSGDSGIFKNCTGGTVIASVRFESSPTGGVSTIFSATTGGGLTRVNFSGGRTSGKFDIGGRRLDTDGFVSLSSTVDVGTSWCVICGVFDFSSSTNSIRLYKNSTTVERQSNAFTAGTSDSNGNTTSGFGGAANTYGIGEMVVLNRVLSSAELSDIFSYMTSRWT